MNLFIINKIAKHSKNEYYIKFKYTINIYTFFARKILIKTFLNYFENLLFGINTSFNI